MPTELEIQAAPVTSVTSSVNARAQLEVSESVHRLVLGGEESVVVMDVSVEPRAVLILTQEGV